MKVVFVTPTPGDISAYGVRALSAYLKRAGHDVRCVFLPGSHKRFSWKGTFVYRYSDEVIDQVRDICKDADLIGVSFMTYFFDRAVQLTEALKASTSAPVIWGGIHPTVRPEEALEYADMVCVGEGEEPLEELLALMGEENYTSGIENIWSKPNGEIIRNPIRPPITDLDSLPFFDYDLEGHYALDPRTDSIRPLDDDFFHHLMPTRPGLKGGLQKCYRTMTDRGCPHKCTYCSVSALKEMYEGHKFFRKRSVANVIEELKIIKARFPFIETVQFFDDTFFSRSTKNLEEFAKLYSQEIGMPFHAQCSSGTLSERKLEVLVDAGLIYTEMGLQTGSPHIRELYNRRETTEELIESTKIIHKFHKRMLTTDYHVILDNPWESDEDILATLDMVLRIPKPFCLKLSTLQFFPGTGLYDKGKAEGHLHNEIKEIYRHPFLAPQNRYPDFLIYLTTFQWIPNPLIRAFAGRRMVKALSRKGLAPVFRAGYALGEKLRLMGKGFEALFTGDFRRFARFFKRVK